MKKIFLFCAIMIFASIVKAQRPSVRIWDATGISTGMYAYFLGDVPAQPPCYTGTQTIGMTPLNPSAYTTYVPSSFASWTMTTPTNFNAIHFNVGLAGGGYDPVFSITSLCGLTAGTTIPATTIFGVSLHIYIAAVSPTQIDIILYP